jgi:hypothetical protein
MIGGCDAMEEFLACGVYLLSIGFSFKNVATGMTAVSKEETHLPIFPVEAVSVEGVDRFLAMVEMDTKKMLGSYGPREHDAYMMAKLLNGGHLNQIFEQMGVPYAPCPLSGTDAFAVAKKKRKVDTSKKTVAKKVKLALEKVAPVKAAPTKKISIVRVIRPKAKPMPRGTSKVELVLAKLIGVSKKLCFLDMPSCSQSRRDEGNRTVQMVSERASRMISFDNLDNSSPDAQEASPPGKTTNVSPPLMITPG